MGNVHLNCGERKNCGPASVAPPRCARTGAREREGASGKDPGTRQGGGMWFPCLGCYSPAAGRQPSRDQKKLWLLDVEAEMLFNSTFCLRPCSARELRNAGADPTLLEILEMFSLCFDFCFGLVFPPSPPPSAFVGLVTIQTTWGQFHNRSGPPCFVAGLCYVFLILHQG